MESLRSASEWKQGEEQLTLADRIDQCIDDHVAEFISEKDEREVVWWEGCGSIYPEVEMSFTLRQDTNARGRVNELCCMSRAPGVTWQGVVAGRFRAVANM
jgi:hypothetical protein